MDLVTTINIQKKLNKREQINYDFTKKTLLSLEDQVMEKIDELASIYAKQCDTFEDVLNFIIKDNEEEVCNQPLALEIKEIQNQEEELIKQIQEITEIENLYIWENHDDLVCILKESINGSLEDMLEAKIFIDTASIDELIRGAKSILKEGIPDNSRSTVKDWKSFIKVLTDVKENYDLDTHELFFTINIKEGI